MLFFIINLKKILMVLIIKPQHRYSLLVIVINFYFKLMTVTVILFYVLQISFFMSLILPPCRSVGCILYELYVGTPPFYTNSIFQLVNLICRVCIIQALH